MSVYKIRYGTPEEFVPTRFAPKSLIDVECIQPERAVEIKGRKTQRGFLLEFPLEPGNEVYGFGLQLKGFKHTGTKKTIRPNADPISNTGDSHAPVPFFVTTEGWGIFVDSARYVEFNCGYTKTTDKDFADKSELKRKFSEIYAFRKPAYTTSFSIDIPHVDGVDIFIFKGKNILDAVCQYNMFSGGGCDVSLWGLGNLYRCDMGFDEEQVVEMAKKFRNMQIPCDILGLEPGWQSCAYSNSLTWDEERFANYPETLRKLTDMGFKVNLWEHAFIHPTSPLYDRIERYSGDYKVWNGLVPDFATDGACDLFIEHHKPYKDLGVSGYKLDECDGSDYTGQWSFPSCAEFPSGLDGEQYHNLFGLLYCKAMLKVYGEDKTLAEVRNMGALAASYPYVLYSDLYDHRDFIRGVANAGFSGLLWSPEVRHAESKSDLIRRIQSVVFSVQSLVNAFYLPEMPWIDKDCVDEAKALFELRMSLIPYLYNSFYEYKTTGKPPIRALVCDYSDDKNTYEIDDQYMFGDSMVVAPMTEDQHEREVYLPIGDWYGFFDNKKYEGGKTYTVETEDIPVFVKSGTILPFATPVQYISEDVCFDIILRCYGDTSASVACLIEDDGFRYSKDVNVITVNDKTEKINSFRYNIVDTIKIK